MNSLYKYRQIPKVKKIESDESDGLKPNKKTGSKKGPIIKYLTGQRKNSEKSSGSKSSLATNYTMTWEEQSEISEFSLDGLDNSFNSSLDVHNSSDTSIIVYKVDDFEEEKEIIIDEEDF